MGMMNDTRLSSGIFFETWTVIIKAITPINKYAPLVSHIYSIHLSR